MSEAIPLLVYLTCPDEVTAHAIAEDVVRSHLAACANILPGVSSVYMWKGALQSENEVAMILKTTTAQEAACRERIIALHPYETPCVVALPIHTGYPAFLQWISQQCTGLP